MFEVNTALVGLGAIAAFGLSATGSAIGCGLAAASAVGSWKRCYVQGKSAPFQLTIFAGAPMTQTIYGLILMLQVLTMDPVLWPAAIGIGFHVSVREVGGEPYDGPYTVTPDFETQELATKDRLLKDNVTVDPIVVARVENPSGGKTIFIGGIFNG